VLDAQSDDGGYPDVAPRLVTQKNGAPAWADAGVIVPWVVYARYGDRRLLARHWDAMERYMDYLARHNPDLLWTQRRYKDYGDWLSVGADTPKDVVATAYWAYDAALMARMAAALDRPERAAHYERLRRGIADAFNRAFVRDDAYVEVTSRPASSASGSCAPCSARRDTPTWRTGSCSTRRSRRGATRSAMAPPRSGSAGTAGPSTPASRRRT
jgi:hypothetical protein